MILTDRDLRLIIYEVFLLNLCFFNFHIYLSLNFYWQCYILDTFCITLYYAKYVLEQLHTEFKFKM